MTRTPPTDLGSLRVEPLFGVELTADEAWMVYDMVTARAETISDAELEVRGGLGGKRWSDLQRKLRAVVLSAGRPS